MKWIYFDVDDTLIHFDIAHIEPSEIHHIDNMSFGIKQKSVDKLIEHYKKGDRIVVWTQGGQDWAILVCQALGITKYVHYFLAKPDNSYDDLHPMAWLKWEKV